MTGPLRKLALQVSPLNLLQIELFEQSNEIQRKGTAVLTIAVPVLPGEKVRGLHTCETSWFLLICLVWTGGTSCSHHCPCCCVQALWAAVE